MIKLIMLGIYSTVKLDAIKIYVIIYHMIKLIMLGIYSTVKLDAMKIYVIIYHLIKIIMLGIMGFLIMYLKLESINLLLK